MSSSEVLQNQGDLEGDPRTMTSTVMCNSVLVDIRNRVGDIAYSTIQSRHGRRYASFREQWKHTALHAQTATSRESTKLLMLVSGSCPGRGGHERDKEGLNLGAVSYTRVAGRGACRFAEAMQLPVRS